MAFGFPGAPNLHKAYLHWKNWMIFNRSTVSGIGSFQQVYHIMMGVGIKIYLLKKLGEIRMNVRCGSRYWDGKVQNFKKQRLSVLNDR